MSYRNAHGCFVNGSVRNEINGLEVMTLENREAGRFSFSLKLGAIASIVALSFSSALAAQPAGDEEPVLRLLSYNINGLPKTLTKGKPPLFNRIAEILRERRAAGTQPQVVLLQEAFDKRTSVIADTTGYKYVYKGPGRRDTSRKGRAHWTQATRKAYALRHDPQKIAGSGLYILSDYPIVDARYKAFDSDACAGFDCLSNKAIQFARLQTPFADEPIDIVNSHFNSRSSAKAPGKLVLRAHKKQTDVLVKLLSEFRQGYPIVIAGDFNTKQDKRYAYFSHSLNLIDAGEVCLSNRALCALADGTKEDELLFRTNDKQFYESSADIRLQPIWAARNFDELLDGKPLSDHLGYEVHYRIVADD